MFVTEITQIIPDGVSCVFHQQNYKNCQVVVRDFVSSDLLERWMRPVEMEQKPRLQRKHIECKLGVKLSSHSRFSH